MRPIRLFLLLLIVGIPIVWIAYLRVDYLHGADFYPLYLGAQQILRGLSPYGPQATHALTMMWDSPWANVGVAYPLPFILLTIPFTLLSFPVASLLWTAIGFILSYGCVLLSRAQSAARQQPAWYQIVSLVLPLTFWPFYDGVRLSQATVMWFGITVLLILGIRRNHVWMTAICVVLLALKPQNGLVFALYGLYWLGKNHKGGLALAMTLGTLLLGASLLIQPAWIGAWLEQMKTYSSMVALASFLPLGSIVLFIVWRFRMEWWAKVAIVQVILFPLAGIYSLLPLLLAWCAFSPLLALFGTSFSVLWAFLPLSPSVGMMWFFILFPLLLVILWEARPAQLRTTSQPSATKQRVSLFLKGTQ